MPSSRNFLVGNKKDLESERIVTKEQAEEYAKNWGFSYFETSAKTGENVQELFSTLVDELIAQM